jgi:hypothetical protein
VVVRRCLIHVGAPKTGTTYLQRVLGHNQQTLALRGLLYPGTSASHDAALDLRGVSFGRGVQTRPVSAWDRLAGEVRDWDGDAVISSELLAWATRPQVERAMRSFPEHEVHIVFTARDLVRQIPAVWQEEIKNRRTVSFEQFLSRLDTGDDRDLGPGNIWGGQDPRLVLGSWGAFVPAGQVHIVTVPPRGAPADTLLERFFRVLATSAEGLDPDAGGANIGLGPTQVELLRQVNLKLSGDFGWQSYDRLVKHGIVLGPLAGEGGGKVVLPAAALPVAAARTERMLAAVRDAGYDVVGDLADLAVSAAEATPDSAASEPPPEAAAQDLLDAGSATIADLLERLATASVTIASLGRDLAEARGELGEEMPSAEDTVAPLVAPAPPAVVGPAQPRHDPGRPDQHAAFVYLGPPKVGLDPLVGVLQGHREALEGLAVRLAGPEDVHAATRELMEPRFAGEQTGRAEAAAWEELAARVRSSPGTWLVADDQFAGASAEAARAAVAALAPAEVHLVAVGRGLDRQLPAEWLQQVRDGRKRPFEHFLTEAVTDSEVRPHRSWFWHVQDLPEMLARWAEGVKQEHVHVVTVPPGEDGVRLAWSRLCAVLGVDPADLPWPDDAVTLEPSAADAELVRQVNETLAHRAWAFAGWPRVATPAYRQVVQDTVLNGMLATHPEGSSLVLPSALHAWVQQHATATARAVQHAGYDVVGDLGDLQPGPVRDDLLQPGRVPDRQLFESAVELVASMSELLVPEEVPEVPPPGIRELARQLAHAVSQRVRRGH